MAEAPLAERQAVADALPKGQISETGVESLKAALHGNATQFAQWRREPMTRRVVGAISTFLTHPPTGMLPDNLLVQYGVTQGLLLALQLCNDPSLLWPGVFGGGVADPTGIPSDDFSASLDEAFN